MDAWYEHQELGRGFQVMMRIRVGASVRIDEERMCPAT